ncbi:MAG TPA: hypothetical protein VML50_17645 [Anaeromyxobacter sp.]|nr:hypothetical protein [Anaeromyxobacter sp.]
MRSLSIAALLVSAALGAGCLVSKPDPATEKRQAGDDALAKSDFAAAAAAYEASLAVDPKQEKVLERLASAYAHLDERDKAAAALARKAELQKDPAQKAETLRQVAGLYLQSADRDRAEPWLRQVLALAPDDDATITWLAELAADRGGARSNVAEANPADLDVALGYYDKLIALRPDSLTGYAHKRIVLTKYLGYVRKQQQAAEQSLGRARGSEQAAIREKIATAKGRAGELQAALDQVDQKIAALRTKPKPAAP